LYNYSMLQGKIVERFKTRAAFAHALGISERSLSLKFNNHIGWKQSEIIKACDLLGVSDNAIPAYFFVLNVQFN